VTDQNGTHYTYDVANRMVSAGVAGGTEYYQYTADNKRVVTYAANGTATVFIYGAFGEKLATVNGGVYNNVYFAGRLIARDVPAGFALDSYFVAVDRLGSVRTSSYLPYGEEISATANGTVKFATYTRDASTGLDYADQRCYTSTFGRFMSADRFRQAAKANDSGSWNKYSFTKGDPVNLRDARGLFACQCYYPDPDPLPQPEPGPGPSPEPSPGPEQAGGSSSESDIQTYLREAVANAISDLKSNPDCLNGFGTTVTRANGFNPIDVLNQISTNGRIIFAPLGPTFTAVTVPIITAVVGTDIPGFSIKFGAQIIINSSSIPGSTAFGNGDLFTNTLTLLHELGHYYSYTSGSGGSALQTPDLLSGNSTNDTRIIKDCQTVH